MTHLARLLLPLLILAGCAAKPVPPMPACEYVNKNDLWHKQAMAAIGAGLGHPDSPEALAGNIATLQAIKADVEAVNVSYDGLSLQTNTILMIDQGIAQLQWLQADGSAAVASPEFVDDSNEIIQALKDLVTQTGVLYLKCEELQ